MTPINFPILGNSLIMAIVILTHVFFAFVAVGGIGIAFVSEWIGYKKGDPFYDRFSRGYVKFISDMMKIGGVLGTAIIALLIGLFPEFAKKLFNIFFWPFIMEVVFFLILMVGSVIYRATWDTAKSKPLHIFLGALASFAAVGGAIIINAIHAFMLTPGRYFDDPSLLTAFFNPTMPESATHLLIPCIVNAAAFAFIYAMVKIRHAAGAEQSYYSWMANYAGKIFAFAILLQPFSGLSFLFKVKSVNREVFMNIINGPVAGFFWPMVGLGVVAVSSSLIYLISHRRLRSVLLVGCLAALTAFSFGGYTRERARKPYLIYGHMYMSEAFADTAKASAAKTGKKDAKTALQDRGCLSCHKYKGEGGTFGPALDKHLGSHHTDEQIKNILKKPPSAMPPFKGTDEELDEFVKTINAKQ